MGCCCAKEADVVLPENKNDPAPDGASSAGSENSADTTSPNAPAHAVEADGPQAPPPGWGGTPELEEEEDDYQAQTEASKASGPRDIGDISGEHGYITGTRKDQEISGGVMDRIKDLEDAGLQTTKKMGRKMLTPRIITDVKETWDKEGNIKREMTHYIEEPDGTKRTEKETVYLAPGDPDPLAAAAE